MRFSLINLDDSDRSDEVYMLTPGYEKTVFAVPLAALDKFIPLVTTASRGVPEARCPTCGGDPIWPPQEVR